MSGENRRKNRSLYSLFKGETQSYIGKTELLTGWVIRVNNKILTVWMLVWGEAEVPRWFGLLQGNYLKITEGEFLNTGCCPPTSENFNLVSLEWLRNLILFNTSSDSLVLPCWTISHGNNVWFVQDSLSNSVLCYLISCGNLSNEVKTSELLHSIPQIEGK